MAEQNTAANDAQHGTYDGAGPVSWRNMIWWMVATCLGFTLGVAALVRIYQGTTLLTWGTWQAVVSGLLFGAITASAQWFVLRRMIPQAGAWIVAGSLGSAAGFALFGGGPPPGRTFPLVAAAIGAIVGLFQWALLRKRAAHAGWWVVATIASAAFIGSFPAVMLGGILAAGGAVTGVAAVLLVILLFAYLALPGAIQGGVLVRLLRG